MGVWCGKLYVAAENEGYRIVKLQEEEDFELTSEKNRERNLNAGNGDHLMVSFQCDLCHFRNLNGKDPQRKSEDFLLLRTIRRASSDAFWLRELDTVEATRKDRLIFLK